MFRLKFNYKSRFLMAVFLLLFYNCQPILLGGRSIDQNKIAGIYYIGLPYGIEIFEIMPNGSYLQFFAINGHELKLINADKWEFIKDSTQGSQLELSNPVIVDDGFGKITEDFKRVNGTTSMNIKKNIAGKIHLIMNEDLGYYFDKIECHAPNC